MRQDEEKVKRIIAILPAAVMTLSLTACAGGNATSVNDGNTGSAQDTEEESDVPDSEINITGDSEEEYTDMQFMIGGTAVSVTWESNESVEALKELCVNEPLVIQMSMYGGFEQVGSIGQSLPRNDVQTTTNAGDIVLYSGNQIVVFYGSNSWAYTRLGHITDKTAAELQELLGNGDVTITISKGTERSDC